MILKKLNEAIKLLFKDKVLLTLGMFPVLIGIGLYTLLGAKLYNFAMGEGQAYIQGKLGDGAGASVLYWVLFMIFFVLLFFIVNWTFVMIVSVLASPFNDLISSRVEKNILGTISKDEKFSISKLLKNFVKIAWNELKKVIFILFLTLLSGIFSLIPPLAPITFLLSALLLTIQFVDYSWSRHDYNVGRCIRDILSNLFSYTLGGVLFLFFMAIPGLNLLMLPVAVIFFTLIFVEKNKKSLTNV